MSESAPADDFLSVADKRYLLYDTEWDENEDSISRKCISHERLHWCKSMRDLFDYDKREPRSDEVVAKHEEKWGERVKIWRVRFWECRKDEKKYCEPLY